MTEEKQDHEPQAGKTAEQQQLEQHEVPEVLEFLKENGVAIVVGVVIAVAGFVGFTAWKDSKAAKVESASILLANSQTAPQFQEIINSYPGTPAVPLAELSLGGAYFDQGQYELALQVFRQFRVTYPEHEWLPVAELCEAQSLEALGNLAEALPAYQAFVDTRPDHYLMPSATFGKARVLEADRRYDDAKAVYEEFIAAYPDSRWSPRAETALDFVGKKQRAEVAAPAPQP